MSDFMSIVALMAILVIAALLNKDKLKQLTIWQNIGIGLSFVIAVAVGTVLIYYGGNLLVGFITNGFLKKAVFLIIAIFVIGFITAGLRKVVRGISTKFYSEQ